MGGWPNTAHTVRHPTLNRLWYNSSIQYNNSWHDWTSPCLYLSSFGKPVLTMPSYSCAWLTGEEPSVVFCCCSLSSCSVFWDAFQLSVIVKSGYLSYCNLIVSLNQFRFTLALFSSDRSLQHVICAFRMVAHFLWKLYRVLCMKVQNIINLWNTQTSLSCINTHVTVKITEIIFPPTLIFDVDINWRPGPIPAGFYVLCYWHITTSNISNKGTGKKIQVKKESNENIMCDIITVNLTAFSLQAFFFFKWWIFTQIF